MPPVFHRDGDVIRHFRSSELSDVPSDPGARVPPCRHTGDATDLLDLTPDGRAPAGGTSSSAVAEGRGDPMPDCV